VSTGDPEEKKNQIHGHIDRESIAIMEYHRVIGYPRSAVFFVGEFRQQQAELKARCANLTGVDFANQRAIVNDAQLGCHILIAAHSKEFKSNAKSITSRMKTTRTSIVCNALKNGSYLSRRVRMMSNTNLMGARTSPVT
jgi:hypothetical protein